LLFELIAEVGEHAAGDLIDEGVAIDTLVGGGGELAELFVHFGEVLAEFEEGGAVVADGAGVAGEHLHHAEGVGLAGAVGKGGDGGLDGVHAGIDRGEVGGAGEACGVVGVDRDGELGVAFECGDQVVGYAGCDDAGHVLNAEGIAAEFFELDAHFHEGVDGVNGAGRVADFAAGVFAGRLGGADGRGQVAQIIERIENAEDVAAGVGGAADKGFDDVVREAGVLHDILAAQEHEVRGFRRGFFEGAKAVEWIFPEKAQAGVDRGAAPSFQSAKAESVEERCRRQHLCGGHAGGCE